MSSGETRLPAAWRPRSLALPSPTLQAPTPQAAAERSRFTKLSDLRRLRGTEQVAAICYRVRNTGIEFLLVQTRAGRWTFPKGKVEAGITHAEAAALEAYEEAGVHGKMEESPFTQYVRRKGKSSRNTQVLDVLVNAHLCEVTRLTPPQESGRTPTWFSVEKTKRRLREDRDSEFGDELIRMLDEAVARIGRMHSRNATYNAMIRRARFGLIEGKRR
jgi:8-oxo-dGTP pyrophosphatase MutT (NUDIX family)